MESKNYSSPEIRAIEIKAVEVLCDSGYTAQDTFFGGDGDAGGSFGDGDVIDGGSY